ncbi:LysR family transcriptional regulator [Paracoccaceae bacterium]|nr:LysR family transcriptional regulator [Paracoccaceae bacterium]
MLGKHINLTWLRTFEAAARHLNFTETAAELGLTQTAVSLHIRSLESRLGNRLFHRRARHLSLTEIGQAYVPTVRQSLSDISLTTASLFGTTTSRMVTLKAPISTCALWLAPRLPKFRAVHPDIELRLVSYIWTDTTGFDDVDVELRVGRGDWKDAASEKLSDETIVPICGVGLNSGASKIQGILTGPLIHVLGQEADWGRYFAAHDIAMPPGISGYFVDTMTAAIELAATGGGYAVVMTRLVEMANATNERVSVVGGEVSIPNGYYLMRPRSQRSKRPEVLLFEDWLFKEFSDES